MAKDIKDIRPRSSLGLRLFSHVLSIFLIFLATLGFFLVLFYNAPLPSQDTPSAESIGRRWWLMEITDNFAARMTTLGPSTTTMTTTAVPTIPTYVSPGNRPARRDELVERASKRAVLPPDGDDRRGRFRIDGRKAYGFGVWGWCGWIRGDVIGDGQCKTKAFWQLPKDAPLDDPVGDLDLPKHSLSIAGFFIAFAAFGGVFTLLALIIAFASPPLWPIDRGGPPAYVRPEETITGTWMHHTSINTFRTLISFIFLCAWIWPTLIVGGIAVGRIQDTDKYPGLGAGFGLGYWILIGSFICFVIGSVLPVFAGLRYTPVKT